MRPERGTELWETHTETCGICRIVFCPPCFFFHRAQHSKPAHGERRERKSAQQEFPLEGKITARGDTTPVQRLGCNPKGNEMRLAHHLPLIQQTSGVNVTASLGGG